MPAPFTTTLIVAGAALTAVNDVVAGVVVGLGVLNEIIVTALSTRGADNGLG